ncbi:MULTISPECIES: SGNH/GDSL hydrolase family protein [unclassified Sinorhizobium]|uniref:SGNH/GDSL hydrolase family protein n=1 Tax=unclassified Sinorhizobium TaxID=2613772 RepID=UPI003525B95E
MIKGLLFFVAMVSMGIGSVKADPLYGRENLAAFYAAEVRAIKTGTPIKIHIVGDSKVVGNGTTDGFRLDQLLPMAARGYPVRVTYEGFGGQNSFLWANREAADFVAQRPDVDLLIIDFGTNERTSNAYGGPQTSEQTRENHLAAINTIRNARSPSQLSVLILGQTPANNWQPQWNQTTDVMREVNSSLKGVAQETNSGYFDTLELFQRAHSEAGWMEQLPTPQFGGGNLHPGSPMNLVLVGELGRYLFPLDYKLASGQTATIYPSLPDSWDCWAGLKEYAPRAQLEGNTVRLSGVVRPHDSKVAPGSVLFTLPIGYRPITNRFFTVSTSNSGTFAEVQVLDTGQVRISANFTGSYIALDSISFRID